MESSVPSHAGASDTPEVITRPGIFAFLSGRDILHDFREDQKAAEPSDTAAILHSSQPGTDCGMGMSCNVSYLAREPAKAA